MKKYVGWILVIVGIIIDQISKVFALKIADSIVIIPNLLNFTLVKNYGAAFGIAQGANKMLRNLRCYNLCCDDWYDLLSR